jgi:hypothetical protein
MKEEAAKVAEETDYYSAMALNIAKRIRAPSMSGWVAFCLVAATPILTLAIAELLLDAAMSEWRRK